MVLYELVGHTLIEVTDEEERRKRFGLTPLLTNATDAFVWEARIRFLDAVRELAPIALQSLHKEVLPVFQQLSANARRSIDSDIPAGVFERIYKERGVRQEQIVPEGIAPQMSVLAWSTLRVLADGYRSELKPICQALVEWAHRFSLTRVADNKRREPPDWVQDTAWGTLNVWDLHPNQVPSMVFYPPARYVEAGVSIAGKAALSKWQRQHYQWLALFQVQRQSPSQIAERLNSRLSDNAILRGVYSSAKIVGLTPRAGTRGPSASKKT